MNVGPVTFRIGTMPTIALPDNSVDLVFCSPPYEAKRTYGVGFKLKGTEWVEWAVAGYLECRRVSRGLVAWVVDGGASGVPYRYSPVEAMLMADLHRAGVHLRRPAYYMRHGIPGSGGPDWLSGKLETVVCAGPGGKLPWSDNTACGHAPKYKPGGAPSHRMPNGRRINKRTSHDRIRKGYKPPARTNPGNIIDCGAVGGGAMGHKLAHENEAPFPLKLAEFFVRSFCPLGGTVLDPFCGSGTTGHAAILHGRRALLLDSRENQLMLSKRRITDVLEQQTQAQEKP